MLFFPFNQESDCSLAQRVQSSSVACSLVSFQGLTYTWICFRFALWPNTCTLLAFLFLTLSIPLLQIPGSHLHLWRKACLLLHLNWKGNVFPKEIKLSFNSGRAVRSYPSSGDSRLSLWQPRPVYPSPCVKQMLKLSCPPWLQSCSCAQKLEGMEWARQKCGFQLFRPYPYLAALRA